MPTTSRRKNSSVIKLLTENPGDFSFQQAVRLLERSTVFRVTQSEKTTSNPIAKFVPPQTEFVRFKTKQSFSFPASEIAVVTPGMKDSKINQWNMDVNFIGLTGISGVLPYHYTETILKRIKSKDRTIEHFLNLFNHRTASLFYQAKNKYNFPIEYERKKLKSKEPDQCTRILLSLIGFGTNHLNNRLHTRDESIIYYAGLFTKKVRTSTGLKQIIQNHFSIPVEIGQFVGQRQELIDDVRTKLPEMNNCGQNNCLGLNVMLGKHGWFAQGKINIILGPLNRSQLHTFAPGSNTLNALDEIVRLYLNMEHDYEFIMRIHKQDIPSRIKLDSASPPTIGWNTWLSSSADKYKDNNSTVDIPVTSRRYR